MAFSLTWEEHGVLVEFSGKVSAAELVKANDVWYSDPRFDTIRYYICDLTRVQHFDLAASDAEFAAATDKGASLTVERLKGPLSRPTPGFAKWRKPISPHPWTWIRLGTCGFSTAWMKPGHGHAPAPERCRCAAGAGDRKQGQPG